MAPLTPELYKRRANGTYSAPTSDDEDDYPRIRQGGPRRRLRLPKRSARVDTPSSIDEDPCGVRHKRTFFKSRAEAEALKRKAMGLTTPFINGINGIDQINGLGTVTQAEAEIVLGTMDESRAGSPVSVI